MPDLGGIELLGEERPADRAGTDRVGSKRLIKISPTRVTVNHQEAQDRPVFFSPQIQCPLSLGGKNGKPQDV